MSNFHAPIPIPLQDGYHYPPPTGASPYGYSEVTPMVLNKPTYELDPRSITRTPSPTPSELEFLSKKGFSSIDFKNFKKYFSRKYIVNWIVIIIGIAITVVSIVLHDKIIAWLEPIGRKVKALPAGWLIPVALLIVISFPPLFGHELVAIIVGVVWGLGIGFAIVALGTLLGELASFLVFRYSCRGRTQKLIEKDLKLGVLAKVVQEGGYRIVLMARLSAIPPHFTTVVFAICGTNLLVFTITAIITLPRQFATVYLGVLAANSQTETRNQKILSAVVIAVTVIITIFAMRYINRKIDEAKPSFIYSRRKARQGENVFLPAEDHAYEGGYSAPRPVFAPPH